MKKSTLAIVVVFLLLLAGVFWSTNRSPERGITRVSLAEIEPEAIDKVEITGKNAVTLTRDGKLWRVESGKDADANAVKRLVEAIPKIVSSDLVTSNPERFADLEVDDEMGTAVKASVGGNEVAHFVVGKSARGGSHVRIGEKVFIVPKLYASTFMRAPSSWLERKLFSDKLADAERVEVALAGETAYALVKVDDKWGLEDESTLPAGFRFDKSGANSLASTLVNARAKEILDEDPGTEATGLDAGDVFAFVVSEGEGDAKTTVRRELRLGKPGEDKSVYAQVVGKDDVITLPEYTAKNLRKKPTDFRDLRMVELDQDKVTRIAIRDADKRLTVEKQGAEWKIGDHSETIPEDFSLDPVAVTRRLSAIVNARATNVAEGVSVAQAGLSRPSATVTATLEDGKTVTVAFGKETKDDERDAVYVRGNADDGVYLVTTYTRKNLTGGIDTFKKTADPGMSNFDPKTLKSLPPDVRAGLMKQMQQKRQQQQMIERMQRRAERQAKKKAAEATD